MVADALTAYLAGLPRPAEAGLPGIAPTAPGLHVEVRALVALLQQLLPRVSQVAEDHGEVMDTLDQIVGELGRREGAALALEQAAALTQDGRR